MSIKDNFQTLTRQLSKTPVTIIAVSKYSTVSQVIEAYEAGVKHFGESKLQDVEKKFSELPENILNNSEWHLIGHLQTNKVKKAVGTFTLIHSIDTLKLAERISREAQNLAITQDILIQVNMAQEESKTGFDPTDTKSIFPQLLNLDNIAIKGLMTMAPFTSDEAIQRECFKGLRLLRDELQQKYGYPLPELSMGMSNDYQIAIQEGSTMVRIGQKIFMER
jgi:pyridoxal phosphate enzyme (YggS family)